MFRSAHRSLVGATIAVSGLVASIAPGCSRRISIADEGPATAAASTVEPLAPVPDETVDLATTERPYEAPRLDLPPAPPASTARGVARCAGVAQPLPAPKVRAACDPSRPAIERISVVHVSDMHGHWHPTMGNRSPFALLRAHVDRRRIETGGRVLFFDAGDDLEKGSIADFRSGGEATVHLLDYLGLDARTIGNHDFAYGVSSVLQQALSPTHELLASNLRYFPPPGATETNFAARRTTVFEVGCARIGVFGLVINGYDESDERIDAPYLGVFAQQHDEGADRYVNTAAALVKELREQQKVDAVIAVNHLGAYRDRMLIDQVPGLDLVISAHDHMALNGAVTGRHGSLVNTGSFVGDRRDARVGEVTLEIDVHGGSVRVVHATSRAVDDLQETDAHVTAEVQRMLACYAPDADRPIAETTAPIPRRDTDAWTPILDAALKRRFPGAAAMIYEAWGYGGIMKDDLSRGPITPQGIFDMAFPEKQRPGGPGFTAFVGIDVSGKTLRDLCVAPLQEPSWKRIHRICPRPSDLREDATYRVIMERRPLHHPHYAFSMTPASFPKPSAIATPPVEAFEALLDYATFRGKACLALDTDQKVPCR